MDQSKLEYVKAILECRANVLRSVLIPASNISEKDKEYYKGKLEGYEQAVDLLKSNPEGLRIELNI